VGAVVAEGYRVIVNQQMLPTATTLIVKHNSSGLRILCASFRLAEIIDILPPTLGLMA
jgi:hypothetical protein